MVVSAYFAFKANQSSRENKRELVVTRDHVHKLELNTNGIREQLVEQHGKAAFLEGHEKGRLEGEVKAAEIVAKVVEAAPVIAAAVIPPVGKKRNGDKK